MIDRHFTPFINQCELIKEKRFDELERDVSQCIALINL